MCLPFFKKTNEFKDKYVYWDTNCYRILGRNANNNGKVWLDKFLRKLKKVEAKKDIEVKVSYLVLTEMLAHLNDANTSKPYLECKYGLYASLFHSNFDSNNLLPSADSEIIDFVTGKVSVTEINKANSLYQLLLQIHENDYNDQFIRSKSTNIQQSIDYIQELKVSWKDSIVDFFIKKHDPSYSGNWQVFASDKRKRNELLTKLRKEKVNDLIYNDFAKGLYEFAKNNINGQAAPNLTNGLQTSIIQRFKPLFSLQYRILELMCESGYNLNNHINDITDYLIIGNLEIEKSLFISNETKNLVPNLHSQGYKKDVWTFEDYCNKLCISFN